LEKPDANYYLKYNRDFVKDNLEDHGNKSLSLNFFFLFCKSQNMLDLFHDPKNKKTKEVLFHEEQIPSNGASEERTKEILLNLLSGKKLEYSGST
jgi:hypothetical protein